MMIDKMDGYGSFVNTINYVLDVLLNELKSGLMLYLTTANVIKDIHSSGLT